MKVVTMQATLARTSRVLDRASFRPMDCPERIAG